MCNSFKELLKQLREVIQELLRLFGQVLRHADEEGRRARSLLRQAALQEGEQAVEGLEKEAQDVAQQRHDGQDHGQDRAFVSRLVRASIIYDVDITYLYIMSYIIMMYNILIHIISYIIISMCVHLSRRLRYSLGWPGGTHIKSFLLRTQVPVITNSTMMS